MAMGDELLAGYSGYPKIAMKDCSYLDLARLFQLFKLHLKMNDKSLQEKHFLKIFLDKFSKSPDAKFSIGPDELQDLKRITQSFDLINYRKGVVKTNSEKPSQIFRRSIYVIKDIKKNERFNQNNIGCFRPKDGISADYYFKILGKKPKVNLKKNNVLKKSFIKF